MIDLNQPILDLEGQPVQSPRTVNTVEVDENGEEKVVKEQINEDLTLKTVLTQSIMLNDQEEDPKVVLARYELHNKVYNADEAKFTKTETEMLKKFATKYYSVYTAGQTISILG